MCCSGPSWKREVVPDHKFDFIDTRDFHSKAWGVRLKYLWLYVLVVKSFLVYVSDIFTAVTMLTTSNWANTIFKSCPTGQDCFIIPFRIGKWLFVGCIIFSFLLVAYEARKARKIINSRDISYAFTNVMANNYYSLRSYDHFCFFCQISNSTKKKDDFAFFVFFTFKSWKRVLFADGPRQVINALTLYSFYLAVNNPASPDQRPWWTLTKYSDNFITTGLIITLLFTVLVFIGSMLLLLAAGICYIPLLCYIQGNLKEYCCHKVDKRIAELMKRKNRQRQLKAAALAKKEAEGDFSHLMNKKGEYIAKPLPQPTLPSVKLDDFDDASSMSTAARVDRGYYFNDDKNSMVPNYPPMPVYQSYNSYDNYGTYEYDDHYTSSQVTLTQAAAPIAGYRESGGGNSYLPNPYSAQPHAQHFFEERQAEDQGGRLNEEMAYDQDYHGVAASHPQPHDQYPREQYR
jgi:hypothetical protein